MGLQKPASPNSHHIYGNAKIEINYPAASGGELNPTMIKEVVQALTFYKKTVQLSEIKKFFVY